MKIILAQQKIDLLIKGLPFTSENVDAFGMYRDYLVVGLCLFLAIIAAFTFNLLFELSKK